jgi:hypothetical protein
MAFEKGQLPPGKGEKIGAPVARTGEDKQTVQLTADESALFQRIMGGDEDWKTIKESDVDDFSLANDPMELPEPAKEARKNKQFAFRWVSRTKERLDEIRSMNVPFKWWVCNSIRTPFLDGLFDPITGGVNRLDCVLAFKPYWMFEKEQEFKRQQADKQAGGGDLKSKNGLEKHGATLVYDGREIRGGSEIQYENVDADARILASGESPGSTFTADDGAPE